MNEQELLELDIKLGEWAGVVHLHLRFTQSLGACFQWLMPELDVCIVEVRKGKGLPKGKGAYSCGAIGLQTKQGWVHYDAESTVDTASLALCLAIEKLIDSEKGEDKL